MLRSIGACFDVISTTRARNGGRMDHSHHPLSPCSRVRARFLISGVMLGTGAVNLLVHYLVLL